MRDIFTDPSHMTHRDDDGDACDPNEDGPTKGDSESSSDEESADHHESADGVAQHK